VKGKTSMRVFENRELRGMFEYKSEETGKQDDGENCLLMRFVILHLH
jgi:hypothetical protein